MRKLCSSSLRLTILAPAKGNLPVRANSIKPQAAHRGEPRVHSNWQRAVENVDRGPGRWALLCAALFMVLVSASSSRFDGYAAVRAPQSAPANEHSPGAAPLNKRKIDGEDQPPARPHLGQWLEQHRDLSPQEQERALRNEPGFNRLPTAQQNKLLLRLQQLNAMPPQQRRRMLDRIEALEKLSPQERARIRNVLQEVGKLPPEKRSMMRQAFHTLSPLPEEQREVMLNSPEYKNQFSDHQRQLLEMLLRIQPRPSSQTAGGKSGTRSSVAH